MKFNTSKSLNDNPIFVLFVIGLAIALIAVIVLKTNIDISKTQIRLNGIWSERIETKRIKRLELINDSNGFIKLAGFEAGEYKIGVFSYKELLKTTIYITKNELPMLLISDGSKTIIIGNGKNSNENYYREISEYIKSNN